MSVLVDSSVWIDYFRGGDCSQSMDFLIEQNLMCTNEIILTELLPALRLRRQRKLIELMKRVELFKLDIDWERIVDHQYKCLKKGINRVGVPDLIILDNAIKNDLLVYSLDRHFKLMAGVFGVTMWSGNF